MWSLVYSSSMSWLLGDSIISTDKIASLESASCKCATRELDNTTARLVRSPIDAQAASPSATRADRHPVAVAPNSSCNSSMRLMIKTCFNSIFLLLNNFYILNRYYQLQNDFWFNISLNDILLLKIIQHQVPVA